LPRLTYFPRKKAWTARCFVTGSMSTRALFQVVTAVTLAACASEADVAERKQPELSWEASAASRDELGVVRWEATRTDDDGASVEGVAPDGSTAATLDSHFSIDGQGARHVVVRFARSEGTATIDLGTTTDGEGTLAVESTTTSLPHGLELAMQDLAEAKPANAALTSTLGLRPLDDAPLVTPKQCSLLNQCSAVGQTLNCAKNTYNLTDCSVKGLVKPVGKGIKALFKVFGKSKDVISLKDCPDSVSNFFTTCLASNPNGSTKTFGNSACDKREHCDAQSCKSDTPACNDQPSDSKICGVNGEYCHGDSSFCCSHQCGNDVGYGPVCY